MHNCGVYVNRVRGGTKAYAEDDGKEQPACQREKNMQKMEDVVTKGLYIGESEVGDRRLYLVKRIILGV
jgi:hypothetical protein